MPIYFWQSTFEPVATQANCAASNSLIQGNNSKNALYLPGAQRDKDEREEEEGHGAAILSLKSQVKLKPVTLSNMISAGKLRSKHPAYRNFKK